MLSGFLKRRKNINKDNKSNYIFYRIVDTGRSEFEYTLQCIKTNVFFSASIVDLVKDAFLLFALYPAQACYIGIKYAEYLNINHSSATKKYMQKKEIFCRYGSYTLSYQDRIGMVSFFDQTTNQQFFMDPRDIAGSKDLIEYFDASQAFYIGLFAGLQTQKANTNRGAVEKQLRHTTLQVIK